MRRISAAAAVAILRRDHRCVGQPAVDGQPLVDEEIVCGAGNDDAFVRPGKNGAELARLQAVQHGELDTVLVQQIPDHEVRVGPAHRPRIGHRVIADDGAVRVLEPQNQATARPGPLALEPLLPGARHIRVELRDTAGQRRVDVAIDDAGALFGNRPLGGQWHVHFRLTPVKISVHRGHGVAGRPGEQHAAPVFAGGCDILQRAVARVWPEP